MTDGRLVVVMGCARSAGAALERLQARGDALPADVEWVELPCGCDVDELSILRAFESGADGVLVLVCYDDACRSLDGSRWAAKRVAAVGAMLADLGLDAGRLQVQQIAPNMPTDLLASVTAFATAVYGE